MEEGFDPAGAGDTLAARPTCALEVAGSGAVWRIVLAGVTTFLTMGYIIFVQPAVLSGTMFGKLTGMNFGVVTAATQ